jgi:chemotaxis-related protein WspD
VTSRVVPPEAGADHLYTGAITRLLERDAPQDYREEWARHVAEDQTVHVAEWRSCVVFRLGECFFAVPTNFVEVIDENCPFHTLPQRRGGISTTLTNVRGELLVCMSMHSLVGGGTPPQVHSEGGRRVYARVVVCGQQHQRVAFAVDEVCGVESFRLDELKSIPATLSAAPNNYAKGLLRLQNRTIALLDEGLLLKAASKNL